LPGQQHPKKEWERLAEASRNAIQENREKRKEEEEEEL
jgi:hypothetical protein